MPKILLVEDDPSARLALRLLLSRGGFEVVDAGDVTGALEAVKIISFDVVISDIGLGGEDGCDLMRKIIEYRPTPGIAMTGLSSESDLERIAAAGFQRVLVKPVQYVQLRAALAEMLPQRDL